ncbi:MAG: hypothetical protein U1B83_03415 [Candidatus Cloacimonadaceae bacterium]|nr:hypothetical protein [Candidatus Cloacimonadaceae bacterium]
MKTACLIIVFCFLSIVSVCAQIYSTTGTGRWHETATWIGGVIPTATDNVVVQGTITTYSTAYCNNLTITSTGTVRNATTVSATIQIGGNLINQGNLISHTGGLNLSVFCGGHVTNSANIAVYEFTFSGSADQNLNNTSGSFSSAKIYDSNAASRIVLQSDLVLTNSEVNLNLATITLFTTGQPARHLTLNGGFLTRATIEGGNISSLTLGSGAYLNNLSATSIYLYGTALIKNTVTIGILVNYATIRNHPDGNYELISNIYVNNFGTIENNPDAGNLSLYLNGNMQNYGNLANYQVILQGTGTQTFFQGIGAQAISCYQFSSGTTTGNVQLQSDLRFLNCIVSMNYRVLTMYQGAQSYHLNLDGGRLYMANLDTNGYSNLNLSNGAYLQQVNGEDHILQGTIIVNQGANFSNVVNQGLIRNKLIDADLTINGVFTNNGTVQNDPSGGLLTLILLNDLYNNGTINNYRISYNSALGRKIYQDSAATFGIQSFISYSNLTMMSDLHFDNTQVDLIWMDLVMHYLGTSHTLYLNGGSLARGYLVTNGFSGLNLSSNAYLVNLVAGDLILDGTVIVRENVSFGDVINYGTFQCASGIYNATFNGYLNNYGTIRTSPGGTALNINCKGHVLNTGTITVNYMYINGLQDQNIILQGTVSPNFLTLSSSIGLSDWYLDGVITGLTGNNINITPTSFGVWQPVSGGMQGRFITITNVTALDTPLNFSIERVGNSVLLQWDQVLGATQYLIYFAHAPVGPFDTPMVVFDTNTADGIVQQVLNSALPRRFYRVTALN